MNFPPELVDKFASHGPAWLTGPVAALIAAAGALIAAGIAFWTVSRQIKANASAVSQQIAADRSERRRAERLDLVTDAATLVTDVTANAIAYEYYSGTHGSKPMPISLESEKRQFYAVESLSISRKLELLGMSEAAEAVETVYEQARLVIDPLDKIEQRADASTVKRAKEHAMSVLKVALDP